MFQFSRAFIVCLFVATLTQSCMFFGNHESSSETNPAPNSDDQLDTQTKVVDYLNDTSSNDPEKYQNAINKFKGSDTIWNNLNSTNAKIKYLEHILNNESICQETYVSRTQDPTTPFVCAHFSLKLYLKYREDDVPEKFLNGDATKYQLTQAEKKLRFPIYDVRVFLKTVDEYHAINAVWAGGTDIEDPENWIFIEPQHGQILFRKGNSNSLVKPENQYLVLHHYLEKLNKDTNLWDDNDKYFLDFDALDTLPEDKIEKLAMFEVNDAFQLKRGVSQVKALVERVAEEMGSRNNLRAEALYKFVKKHPRFRFAIKSAINHLKSRYSALERLNQVIEWSEAPEFEAFFADAEDGKTFGSMFFNAFMDETAYIRALSVDFDYSSGQVGSKYFIVKGMLTNSATRRANYKSFLQTLGAHTALSRTHKSKIETFLKEWNKIIYPIDFDTAKYPKAYRTIQNQSSVLNFDTAKSYCSDQEKKMIREDHLKDIGFALTKVTAGCIWVAEDKVWEASTNKIIPKDSSIVACEAVCVDELTVY